MELSELLSKAGSLPEAQQRKVAAILGSLVADAAGECKECLSPAGIAIASMHGCTWPWYHENLIKVLAS